MADLDPELIARCLATDTPLSDATVKAVVAEWLVMRDTLGWGFIGPCAHGRDPYTRCDTCGLLDDYVAAQLAEREACARLVDDVIERWPVLYRPVPIALHELAVAIRARGAA